MNKHDINRLLDQLCEFPLPMPLLRDLSDLASGKNRVSGPLKRRLERLYIRLCLLSKDLSRLDLKKARLGAALGIDGYKTLEDFAFSGIDFSRYHNITETEFDKLFLEGLSDFDESFFKKNFGLGKKELQSVMQESYQKTGGQYTLRRENSLVLSVMRALETSLETLPLLSAGEVIAELHNLPAPAREKLPKPLYPALVLALDGATITHSDNMTTRLFIAPSGDLSGTFRPEDKPWTQVLIPAEAFRH